MRDDENDDDNDNGNEKDVKGLLKAWESLQHSVEKPSDISVKEVFELAKKYNVTGGKWMFWAETGPRIDQLWAKVAKGIVYKELLAVNANVSTRNMTGATPRYNHTTHAKENYLVSHVVCIFNKNFLDFEEVCESEKTIRDLGLKLQLAYKPNVFTELDIFSKNPWNIHPIIYQSTYSITEKKGIIYSGKKF